MIFDNAAKGATDLTTGQVSVTSTAVVIAAAAPGERQTITVVNSGTTDVWLGGSGVTTTTGILLAGVKGQTLTLSFSGALYGIVASTAQTVSFATVA